MNRLFLILMTFIFSFSQTDSMQINTEHNIDFLVMQHSQLSENFYVNYTIGQRATESIKMNFYILPSVRQNMISAQNATIHNLNWAHQIYAEQKNQYYRGINPLGLLMVLATWSGLIEDPTTENALQRSMKQFVTGDH